MTVSDLLPSWDDLLNDYLTKGIPGKIVVRPDPHLSVFIDSNASRLGAIFAVGDGVSIVSPLDAITISDVRIDGIHYLELATRHSDLFRNFYFLLGDIFTEVVTTGKDIRSVLPLCLQRWQALLQASVVLSDERQAGLYGELWALNRLIRSNGPWALDAWTGPTSASHDFRLGNDEIEVKTTSGSRRVHVINGLDQLQPSPGCGLYILSLRLIAGGTGGQTLPEAIANISTLIQARADRQIQFEKLLSAVGYRDPDAPRYTKRRRLADAPSLIPVEDGCPRITRSVIDVLPSNFAPDRIRNASYEVDLTGLGAEDGTPDFIKIIPES